MSKDPKQLSPVKVDVLSTVRHEAARYRHKIDSMIEDHYNHLYSLTDAELLPILEVKVSSQILMDIVDEMLDDAKDAGVDSVPLKQEELVLLISLSKMVNSFFSVNISPRFSVFDH